MMVSPISSVSFRGETVDFARQGAHSKPGANTPAPNADVAPKKSSTGKKVLYGTLGVLAVAASLVALHKTNVLKVLTPEVLQETKWYSPKMIGHYLSKAGEAIAKYTYDPIVKLFSKAPADPAPAVNPDVVA